VEFRILGPLEVVREGSVLPTPPNKPRALLVLLLLRRGEAVGLDELADDLWGGQPPATAIKSIQVYVSQLRKGLGERVLETRGRGYALVVDDDSVDAARFERLLDRGTELRATGEPKAAAEVLTEALTLWRGPALADFTYEPWAQPDIARLADLRLAALEERIDADLEVGRHATLVGELTGLVERNPGRERLLGQLMLALYRSGRQTEALDAYREQRRRLDEELGLEPSVALRELEAAMLRQEPSLERPARATTARSRRRTGKLVALAGAALLAVAGIGGAAVLGQEDVTPAVAAVEPLTAPSCSPMDYRPGTRPRHLIVSDQWSELGAFSTQVVAAVEFVIRERGFQAGGTPIAYQVCDSDPSKCDQAAKDYADNPSVIGVIGPVTSSCAEAQIPVANRARPGPLAIVSPTTTRVGLTRPTPLDPDKPGSLYPTGMRNFVRVQAADDFQLAALAMYARRSGIRSLFLIAGGSECDTDGGPFGAVSRRVGLEVAGCAFYSDALGNPDHVARRAARSHADAVYLPQAAVGDNGLLIRALRARAARDLLILGGDGFATPDFMETAGRAANGMRLTVAGIDPNAVTGPGRELIDRLRGTVGEPHPYTVNAVQATELLLDAIARSDGTRRSVVRELFRSEVRGGVLGDFSVTPTGDTTANRVTIYQVQDGELVLDRVFTPPLGLVVSPRAESSPAPASAAPEGVEMLVVPVGSEDEALRLCEDARESWPRAFAGHGRVFFDKADGIDFTCVEPTDSHGPGRGSDGPRAEVRYIAPVSGPEHAERVCDAARERWPRAYARYDEVLLDQGDGRDLTCVRP
jgi:DNA-binding SARP family transcriptional activator/ABC-type branched-subunit amino acid transport system substrate-binding protein